MSIKKHSDKKRIGSFGAMLQNVFHEKQQKVKQEEDLLEQKIKHKQEIQREQEIKQEAIEREQGIKKEIEEQSKLYQYAFDEIKHDFEQWKLSSKNNDAVSAENKFKRFHNHQLTDDESNETELFIGFDFGSSTTKVVIGDHNRNTKYPIKFDEQLENAYLKPTSIFLQKKTFNFSDGEKLENLKKHLVENRNYKTECGELSALEVTIAYIALVLRQVRHYFFETHSDIYKNDYFVWSIHCGVPSKNYDDKKLCGLFKKAVLAGWDLSIKNENVTVNSVQATLKNIETHPDTVEVFPEVVAEIAGYAKSPLREEGLHLLIDIGAMTTDIAMFNLMKENRIDKYPMFSVNVSHYGVIEFQKYQFLQKITDNEKLNESSCNRLKKEIEESVLLEMGGNYFDSLKLENGTPLKNVFLKQFKEQIKTVFDETWGKRISEGDKVSLRGKNTTPKAISVFICGGGSQMSCYDLAIKDCLNGYKSNLGLCGFSFKKLKTPENFSATYFYRLAVAYGLSMSSNDIGCIVESWKIPDIKPLSSNSLNVRERPSRDELYAK